MVTTRAFLERTPVALAHRGGSLYAPNVGLENTMTAFGNAVDLGYTHLETDVHVTRDGLLVAFHDTRLDRVSNARGRIRDLPWSEVSHAEVGDGGHVPLLTDVLDAWPDINLNIDLKAPGTAEPLWRHHRGAGSARPDLCRLVLPAQHLPLPASLARHGGDRSRTGRHGVGALRARCAHGDLPHTRGRLPGAAVDPAARTVGASGHAPPRRHGTPLRQAGPRLDHRRPRQMRRLLDLGVDGLVSDRIDLLKDVLVERGTSGPGGPDADAPRAVRPGSHTAADGIRHQVSGRARDLATC